MANGRKAEVLKIFKATQKENTNTDMSETSALEMTGLQSLHDSGT